MAFNVSEFTAQIERGRLAYSSNFMIQIFPPNILIGTYNSSDLQYRINTAEMPGRSVNTINYLDYGAPYNIGGKANYVDFKCSIICSEDMRERDFFLTWQDLIAGPHRDENNTTPSINFNIGYYNDYISKQGVEIVQYSNDGQEVKRVKLIDVFPTDVGTISTSWDQSQIMILPITMSYRYFQERSTGKISPKNTYSQLNNISEVGGGLESLADNIINRELGVVRAQAQQQLATYTNKVTSRIPGPLAGRVSGLAGGLTQNALQNQLSGGLRRTTTARNTIRSLF
jgi:hypothetical protein